MLHPELDEMVLTVIASMQEVGEEIYGASINRKIKNELHLQLSVAILNATLYRLLHSGLLTYYVGKTKIKVKGPQRKIYSLSYAGSIKVKALKEMRRNMWSISSLKIN
jgi:DNA-binding PadR family transcriptional regulator